MNGSLGPVIITAREIWDELVKANEKLTQLSGLPDRIADHEVRLRGVEKTLWKGAGIGGIIGGTLGSIAAQLLGG